MTRDNRKDFDRHEEDQESVAGEDAQQSLLGEKYGNNYGYGREGSYIEPDNTQPDIIASDPKESDYVKRYDPPTSSGMLLESGPHSGRGPRNCDQPVTGILGDACVELTNNGQIDASQMEVAVDDTRILLTGIVSSEEERGIAEQLVRNIAGVSDVINNLVIDESN